MTVEDWIKSFSEEGEEDTVGENLILNRGPANPDDLDKIERSAPDGTAWTETWSFGDDLQRMWFNPSALTVAGFSKLSSSFHAWRYPNKVVYMRHLSDIGDFFTKPAWDGVQDLVDTISASDTPQDELFLPVKEVLTLRDPRVADMVLGGLLDLKLRDLQTELMLERLGAW